MRRLLPYMWGAVALLLLQLAWVWTSRRLDDRRMLQRAEARQQRAALPPAGTALNIPWFYANRGAIVEGEQAVVCYGVENAREVRLDPPVEDLKPARNRCFSVAPEKTTTYTLTAAGDDGKQTTASFTLRVGPAPPRILFVSLSAPEIKRGTPWTWCYGVAHATRVWLEPGKTSLAPSERMCLQSYPVRSTNFTLVAADDLGRTDKANFSLVVR